MRLPLFWKVLLVTLLPLVAFTALGLTTNYLAHRAHDIARQAHYLASKESEAETGRRLEAIARAASAVLRAEDVRTLQPGDESLRTYRRLRHTLSRVATRSKVRRIYLFDRSLESLCDTQAGVAIGARYYHLEVDRRLVRRAFAGKSVSTRLFTGKDGVPYKTGFSQLTDEKGQVVAVLAVEGATETYQHLKRLKAQLAALNEGLISPFTIGAVVVICLLLLVGASLLITRSVIRPARQLVTAAEIIGQGDLERPVRVDSRDEMGVLAKAMDRMRGDLHTREQELQLMLSGIAHEVRNPLGGMKLFAGLLEDEVADNPDTAQMVERIQRELEYLDRVVREFLDFARHQTLDRKEVDLGHLGQELQELLAGEAEARGATLSIERQGDLSAQVDVEKIRMGLMNVVRNAIQATPEEGTVTLEIVGTDDAVTLICRDTGKGIAAEDLDKIFNAFYTTRERGTGLGLAIVKKHITAHGGTVEMDSAPGEGTTIRLTLPRAASEKE